MDELEMDTDTRTDDVKAFDAYDLAAGLSTDHRLKVISWILLDLRAEEQAKIN